jgi:exopolyphosphatase/guanosine-5'-triphosphate,3'-diphosphate pyrophosphatase
MLALCPVAERRRAIIDIGSNSIRLVVYPVERRVPATLLNEKVSARLGKTLQDDNRLPAKAIDVALRGLARFRSIVEAIGVESLTVVATAAVRDASNGPEFLEMVRGIGLLPTLLSGSEEAAASARGVMCAFPDAEGVVADLGGGSLELVQVASGEVGHGVTLPLGTLRVAKMREKNTARALQTMRAMIEAQSPRGLAEVRPLYVVGGSWRALAQFAMNDVRWPIRNQHGFVLEPRQIAHLVSVLTHTPVASIRNAGVSSARAGSIADAAIVLAALVRHLRPSRVIVSSFGLREGLVFADMPAEIRRKDPLIANLEDQLGGAAKGSIYGEPLHRWIGPVFAGESAGESRLRLAASWLGLVARQPEKPLRRARALEVALGEPMIGADACDRGRLAAALLAFVGEKDVPSELGRLCSAAQLERAARLGCAMRLAEKLSAGMGSLLEASTIRLDQGKLELVLADPALYGEAVEQEHAALAQAWGVTPAVSFPDGAAQPSRDAIFLPA